MIDFHKKGILCAYFRATEPRTPSVEATALQPPSMASHDVLRIEIERILCETRLRGMLDSLIDRKNGHVASARKSPGIVHPIQMV